MVDVFPVSDDIKKYFIENYIGDNNTSLQKLLISLRKMGCSQMQTVFLLYNQAGLSFREANKIVLDSDAWARQ